MRRSFSLLEIVFSIVIIGIAFSGIPAIMAVVSQSTENTLESRGFYHTLAKMKVITNKPWDEGNVNDFIKANIYYILDTAEDAYDCTKPNSAGRLRFGQFEGQYRRMCYPSANAGVIAREDVSCYNCYNDIDDFSGNSETVEGFALRYTVDYVATQPNATPTATYRNNDAASGTTTNTKRVRIDITNGPSFYYYSFNIGTPRPYIKNQ